VNQLEKLIAAWTSLAEEAGEAFWVTMDENKRNAWNNMEAAALAAKTKPTSDLESTCKRCGSPTSNNKCTDETCPFSEHLQICDAGWNGHPEHDPHPEEDGLQITCICPK